MPMLEDFCPGHPITQHAKKQRTLALM
jgi:hypothetical protein